MYTAGDDPHSNFETFNMAVEAMAKTQTVEESHPAETEYVSKLDETRRRVAQQREAVEKYAAQGLELKRKGDAIYADYQRCDDVLKSITAAREKLGWDEVMKRLAGSDENVTVSL